MIDFLIDQSLGLTGLLRSTLVGGATLLALRLTDRCGPGWRIGIACSGLLLMLLVPHADRMPHWNGNLEKASANTSGSNQSRSDSQAASDSGEVSDSGIPLWNLWSGMERMLGTIDPPSAAEVKANERPEWTARRSIRWILLIFVPLGALRLVWGWMRIRHIVRHSVPCEAPLVNSIAATLAQNLGWKRTPEIRETRSLETAAVVGVGRPILLLSANWRLFSEDRLRAMLAHEFAHIERRDFATLVFAQTLLTLLFYHPLAHRIVRELRLSQEMRADLMAAQFSGGRRHYARALAELALTRESRSLPVQLQAFLTYQPGFLRRIDMLRNTHSTPRRSAWVLRLTGVAAICAAAWFASILRPAHLPAQDKPATPPTAEGNKADLSKLAASASAYAAILIDVDGLLNSASGRAVLGALDPAIGSEFLQTKVGPTGLTLQQLDRALVLVDSNGPGQLVVQSLRPIEGQVADPSVARIDAWTLAINADPRKKPTEQNGAAKSGAAFANWPADDGDAQIRVALDMVRIRNAVNARDQDARFSGMFSPLLEKTQSAYIDATVDEGVHATARIMTDDPQAVAQTLDALKVLAMNWVSENLRRAADGTAETKGPEEFSKILAIGNDLLASINIVPQEDRVRVDATLAQGAAVAAVVPPLLSARAAARRMSGSNNLKQLLLACHNYASVHGHFPAAVTRDESGVERSWRVEVLPYLEQQALYDAYRKDQPWDSEANLRVLNAMPATFRNPNDTAGTNETPYKTLNVAGAGLASQEGKAEGPEFRNFTDGLSNSILLVETLPTVPWTKPVDVDSPESLMEGIIFDSGIQVALGDGSVRFLHKAIDPATLKAMITRSGGEVIQQP